MKPACPRLFEVEALRDGRLTGADVARFQSHLGVCAICAREARALHDLGQALRVAPELPQTDELHVRRERTRLLAAFDARLVPAPRASRAKLWVALAATLGVLSLTAAALLPVRSGGPVVAAGDSVKVQADSSAQWSRRSEAHFERIVLTAGTCATSITNSHWRQLLFPTDLVR